MTVPRRADVVVVGGGITGASLAYHLSGRGKDVVLLERSVVAGGPTGRSTAIIRQHYSQPLLVRMAVHGLRLYRDFFARELGASCGFVRAGVLWAVSDENRAGLERNVALAQDVGAQIELVEPTSTAVDTRISRDGVAAFALEPTAGHCDPYLATAGFVSAARQLGAAVVERAAVASVQPGHVALAGGGAIDADAVVVAAGPWSPALLAPLGYELPIRTARAEVGRFRLPSSFGAPPRVLADFSEQRFYFKPAEPGFLEVGTLDPAHAERPLDPDHIPEGADAATLRHFERALAVRLPSAAAGHWRGAWSGAYDVTPDWQPAIGAVPGADGVFVAAGFSGHGLKLAPAVGSALAERVCDGAWGGFDLSLFDPARFERGDLISSPYGYSVVG